MPSRARWHDLTVQQHLDQTDVLHCPFPSHQICHRRFRKQEEERASREDTTRPDSIQQNAAQPDLGLTQRLARTHTRRCDPSPKPHRHISNIVPKASDDARHHPTSDGARVNLRGTRRSVDGIAWLGGTVGLITCSEIVEKLCLGVN